MNMLKCRRKAFILFHFPTTENIINMIVTKNGENTILQKSF